MHIASTTLPGSVLAPCIRRAKWAWQRAVINFTSFVSEDQGGTVATSAGITLANFYLWNSAVESTCTTLDLDDYVMS